MRLILGTRGSQLAVTQSTIVADALRARGHEVELKVVRTTGDRARGSLATLAGLGVFAAELRTAILDGACDFAVHSYKDLPVAPVPGLVVAAVPPREEPGDALCARDSLTLAQLPPGSRVGTGSPRRVAQLRALRPDCEFVDIRGNVGTRLARVAPGDLDAVVLAASGLRRVGRQGVITELLDILPAPGQGALALECRDDDATTRAILAELDDAPTRIAVDAERGVLAGLGGGCAAPIAARGEVEGGELRLRAGVFSLDGRAAVTDTLTREAHAPHAAGLALARLLLDAGAAGVTPLGETRDSRLEEFHDDARLWGSSGLLGRRVLIPREFDAMSAAVEGAGAVVWNEPLTRRVTLPARPERLPEADWVAVTSAHTVRVLDELGVRIPDGTMIAAVGPATARALRDAGYHVDLVPPGSSSAEDLLAAWPRGTGTVVVPGSARSRPVLVDGLRAIGFDARAWPIYTTEPVAASDVLRQAWADGEVDAVVVTSGSIAESIDASLGWPDGVRVVALGAPTAAVLGRLGVAAQVAETQDPRGVTAALREVLERATNDEEQV